MKKSFVVILLCLIGFMSHAQYQPEILGTAQRVRNVPVFMYAYPLADYEEVETLTAIASGLTVGLEGEIQINEMVNELVGKAKRKQRKGKIADFDAIIIDPDSYQGILIRFTDEPSLISEPIRVMNVPVFMYAYPEGDYEEVRERWSFLTLSGYSDIQERTRDMVRIAKRRAQKGKIPHFDAIVIDPISNTHTLISYSQ